MCFRKRRNSEVECVHKRKTKDLLTMETCPIVSAREVSERSDEFGRMTAVIRSPAEILPSGHSILQGAPPVMLESAGIFGLILTTVDQTPFLQMDGSAGKTQLCENSTDL